MARLTIPEASTLTIAPNSNRLTGTSGTLTRTYGYDDAGNATSFGGITFAYNNRGRMKSSTRSGVTTSYTYNALGQLIKKGSSALYYYDDAGHVLGIYESSGSLTEEIVWLGDIPLATLRPNAGGIDVYYIHSDHLNTPRLITDVGSNSVRWRWDADPFGVGEPNENPSGVGGFAFELRFPGQMFVAEAGLYYNYYRDYDPATGRYVQSDPIGLDGGINTYAYALSNPVSNVDPEGLQVAAPWFVPRPWAVPRPRVEPRPWPVDPAFPIPDMSERDQEKARAECEQACDEQWDRDMFQCEWMWKMKGRPKGGWRACKEAANRRYVECYQSCGPMC